MIVKPSLTYGLRWGYAYFGVGFLILAVGATAVDVWNDQRWTVLGLGPLGIASLALLPAVVGVLRAVSRWPFAVEITREGLRGRSRESLRRTELKWSEIDTVGLRLDGIQPGNSRTNASIMMHLEGVDPMSIHAEVLRVAGPDHVLTRSLPEAAELLG